MPSTLTTNFERNVFLKENLSALLATDSALDCHYWIIHDWGKIRSFKRNDRNDQRIKRLPAQLEQGRWTRDSFGSIASLSKVASFSNHRDYAIYDARAVYTLNWLLFKWGRATQLFPQPAGRNPTLTQLDQATLFGLADGSLSAYSYKGAYARYCEMLRSLAEEVYGEGTPPYRLEMLLFRVAPTWTVSDMRDSITVTISFPT
jgi:hypothetical protein